MCIFSDSPIILTTINLVIKSDLLECIENAYICKSFRGIVIDEFYDILVSCEFQDYIQSVWQLQTLYFLAIAMFGTLPTQIKSSLILELCL